MDEPSTPTLPAADKGITLSLQYKDFDINLATRILEGLISGSSLIRILEPAEMPSYIEVKLWEKKHPEFRTAVMACKRMRAEKLEEGLYDTRQTLIDRFKRSPGTKSLAFADRVLRFSQTLMDKQDKKDEALQAHKSQATSKAPPQLTIVNPFANRGTEVVLEDLKVDSVVDTASRGIND